MSYCVLGRWKGSKLGMGKRGREMLYLYQQRSCGCGASKVHKARAEA